MIEGMIHMNTIIVEGMVRSRRVIHDRAVGSTSMRVYDRDCVACGQPKHPRYEASIAPIGVDR